VSPCQIIGRQAKRLLESPDSCNILLHGSMHGEACMCQQARAAVAPDETRGRTSDLPSGKTEVLGTVAIGMSDPAAVRLDTDPPAGRHQKTKQSVINRCERNPAAVAFHNIEARDIQHTRMMRNCEARTLTNRDGPALQCGLMRRGSKALHLSKTP